MTEQLPDEVVALPDNVPDEVKQHLAFHENRRQLAEYLVDIYPEPVTASGVGEHFGWNPITANNRLNALRDIGMPIESKTVSYRTNVWWYVPDEEHLG